jgi:hypothetical protein
MLLTEYREVDGLGVVESWAYRVLYYEISLHVKAQ